VTRVRARTNRYWWRNKRKGVQSRYLDCFAKPVAADRNGNAEHQIHRFNNKALEFDAVDANFSGQLDFAELCMLCRAKEAGRRRSTDQLRSWFKGLDTDNSGSIGKTEVRASLRAHASCLDGPRRIAAHVVCMHGQTLVLGWPAVGGLTCGARCDAQQYFSFAIREAVMGDDHGKGLHAVLAGFDTSGSGWLSRTEFGAACAAMGFSEVADQLYEMLPPDEEGRIDTKELIRALRHQW
jgi:Ca2+-binding EF-hand superfamily protein